jgi:hypothetical protein
LSSLTTNFNQSPYNDDYDETKDFYRVVHKPATPVQARELTQAQTIVNKQLQRLGDHLFKDGSVVDGCSPTYHEAFDYVSVVNRFSANADMAVSDVDDTFLLVGNTTGVRAVALATKAGFEASFPSSNRFYVKYLTTGPNSVSEFARGEYIKVYGALQSKLGSLNSGNFVDEIQVIDSANTTGQGYGVSVSDGGIYHKGFQQRVAAQTLVIKEFDTDPTGYRVGFDTLEEVITEDQDDSLYDNSAGFTNFNAPGAHRLKLTPVLRSKLRTDVANSTNFFAIIEFDNSSPTEQNIDPVYNKLGQEFADRTREESGDYVVKPFTIETFPGINANSGLTDANLFAYSVSTGIGYVLGYRVEKIGTSNVVTRRADTTALSETQIATASYGNYAIVTEYLGDFDAKNLQEVTLYDAAQGTITDLEKASGARAGSVVGYANVKAVEYYTGTKGLPSCQYLLYLDNVRMSSGKSFANDVKSVYATGSYGAARADVLLTSNRVSNGSFANVAQVYDGAMKCLVFPIGRSVKTLNGESGDSDTQFVFRDVANATLATNGYISVTTNPAGAGGSERINASGNLTSLGEKLEFDVVLTANDVVTANLTGTVSVNTSTTDVVGTGTSFSTNFQVGSYFRAAVNTSLNEVRRVVTVVNATFMTVASAFSDTNTSTTHARLYPEGTHVDLSALGANISVTSNTTFGINTNLGLGGSLLASNTVQVVYPVLRHDCYPTGKVVRKHRYVAIDCSNAATTSVGPWSLGLPDVYSIEAAYVGTTLSENNSDVKTWFNLDTGQRDASYEHAQLYLNPQFRGQLSASSKILVKLSHFEANSTGGVGFFSVDSYPTSNSANDTTIGWGEIPIYKSASGSKYDLRDCVDFRFYRSATAASGNSTVFTTNPPAANANTYQSSTVGYVVAPDTNLQADVTYYLPRKDLVVINKNGDLSVINGDPAVNPRTPLMGGDAMLLAEVEVPAWPTLTQREAEVLGRHDKKVRHTIKTNRRYTMRDVGVLDQRITRMEYYTVLNAVEQKARDFSVPDVNGLDRFKNGIFADPFNSHALGKVDDPEYLVSIDQQKSVARPKFTPHDVDYRYDDESSTTQRTGNYVTLPYEHVQFIDQDFASKFRNCTESMWSWHGKLQLFPSYDTTRDETRLPNINVTLDLSQPWEDFANSPYGSNFGEWRTVSTNSSSQSSTGGSTTTTTTTNRTTQEQIIERINVETLTNSYDLGTYVKDVSIEPYMRARTVSIIATNLKPSTVVHVFFDNVNVDEFCAPGTLSGVVDPEVGREDRILDRSGAYGSELTTDSQGTVMVVFSVPAGTFRTGDRKLLVCDVEDLAEGDDAILTSADATFTASNISVTKQGATLSTIEPEISVVQSANTRTVVSTTTSSRTVQTASRTTRPADPGRAAADADPIAQSFKASVPTMDSGMFLTKLDLYFERKDPELGVTVYVMEMRYGTPDSTRIIGRVHLTSDEVDVSDDAATATTFELENPVFLASDVEYAFMVAPDGDSPEYRLWCGETGEYDVRTGVQIFQNPYSGVMFVSANRNTWTPIQKEDIKFKAYRARFTTGSRFAYFENEDDEFFTFSGLQRANSDVSVMPGDLVYTTNALGINSVSIVAGGTGYTNGEFLIFTDGGQVTAANVSLTTNSTGGITSFTYNDRGSFRYTPTVSVNSIGTSASLTAVLNAAGVATLTGANSTQPFGVVQYVDEPGQKLVLDTSTGGWSEDMLLEVHRPLAVGNSALITANSLVINAVLSTIDDRDYHSVVPRFGVMQPSRTSIRYGFIGTDSSFSQDSAYFSVTNDYETEFMDKTRVSMSFSNEEDDLAGEKSCQYRLELTTESEFVSPVVDLRRKTGLHVENVVNDDLTDESLTRHGAALAKYVSKNVVLDDGQEAEDLMVWVSAYRPSGTDVYVYAKLLNHEDPESFDAKAWTLMTANTGEFQTSNPLITDDYIDFQYGLPTSNASATSAAVNSSTGIVEYSSSGGSKYTGYKTFCLKIVMSSSNPAVVPRLNDARAICLQV